MTTTRHPCTPDEAAAIACLGTVRYPVASWDKRFARSLDAGAGLTEREAPQVWRLLLRYRRQWNHPDRSRLLALAEQLSAPDLRKVEAQNRAGAEIERLRSKYMEEMRASKA